MQEVLSRNAHILDMTYLYYRYEGDKSLKVHVPSGFFVRVVKPKLNSFHSLLWTLFSGFKFREYQLVEKETGCVVSKAEIMPKIPIFAFMQKGGIHIGPCWTNPEYRGRGFYPFLLSKIIAEQENKNIYIFCSETNISSINGIQKLSFKKFGVGRKNRLGIYVVEKYV